MSFTEVLATNPSKTIQRRDKRLEKGTLTLK